MLKRISSGQTFSLCTMVHSSFLKIAEVKPLEAIFEAFLSFYPKQKRRFNLLKAVQFTDFLKLILLPTDRHF